MCDDRELPFFSTHQVKIVICGWKKNKDRLIFLSISTGHRDGACFTVDLSFMKTVGWWRGECAHPCWYHAVMGVCSLPGGDNIGAQSPWPRRCICHKMNLSNDMLIKLKFPLTKATLKLRSLSERWLHGSEVFSLPGCSAALGSKRQTWMMAGQGGGISVCLYVFHLSKQMNRFLGCFNFTSSLAPEAEQLLHSEKTSSSLHSCIPV